MGQENLKLWRYIMSSSSNVRKRLILPNFFQSGRKVNLPEHANNIVGLNGVS